MNDINIKYFFNILKSVLNGTEFDQAPDGVDFAELFALAKAHGLANAVGWCAKAIDAAPEDIKKRFEYEKNRAISREAVQEVVISAFLDKMEVAGLKCMPLKGYRIKNMYPHPALRYMTDTDILVDSVDLPKITSIMEELGFKYDHSSNFEVIFQSPQMVVELHTCLVPTNTKRLYEYYGDGRSFARLEAGKSFICEMSPEDFYVFTLAHAAKHYVGGGIGLRHVCDIYLLKKAELDRAYIDGELTRLNLLGFDRLFEGLADMWLSPTPSGAYPPEVYEMGRFVLLSGSFGTNENRLAAGIYREAPLDGSLSRTKKRMVLRRIFPTFKTLGLFYPQLQKRPFLYPIFWTKRAFSFLFKRRAELSLFSNIKKTDSKKIDEFARHCRAVGLPEDL